MLNETDVKGVAVICIQVFVPVGKTRVPDFK